jgi:HSP20 family protein
MYNLNNLNNMSLVKFRSENGLNSFPTLTRKFGFPSFLNEALDQLWTDEKINWMPAVNIKENPNSYKIDLAVPGMEKKDLNIEIENGIITISGERKEEVKESDEKVTRMEFHYGAFKRSFGLPDAANTEDIQANFLNGVLSLSIGKKEEMKTKPRKQITIE